MRALLLIAVVSWNAIVTPTITRMIVQEERKVPFRDDLPAADPPAPEIHPAKPIVPEPEDDEPDEVY